MGKVRKPSNSLYSAQQKELVIEKSENTRPRDHDMPK
jgi:hypothetical protein